MWFTRGDDATATVPSSDAATNGTFARGCYTSIDKLVRDWVNWRLGLYLDRYKKMLAVLLEPLLKPKPSNPEATSVLIPNPLPIIHINPLSDSDYQRVTHGVD